MIKVLFTGPMLQDGRFSCYYFKFINLNITPELGSLNVHIRKTSNSSLVSSSLESASLTSSLRDSVFGTSLDCLCLWKFIFVFVILSLSLEIYLCLWKLYLCVFEKDRESLAIKFVLSVFGKQENNSSEMSAEGGGSKF